MIISSLSKKEQRYLCVCVCVCFMKDLANSKNNMILLYSKAFNRLVFNNFGGGQVTINHPTVQQMYVFLDILTMFTKSFINRSILGINQCRIPIQNRQCNEKTVDPFFELANYEFYYFFNVKTQPKINYKILFKFTLLIK